MTTCHQWHCNGQSHCVWGDDTNAWRAKTPAQRGRVRLREDDDDKLDVGQGPRPSETAGGAAWDDKDDAKRVLLRWGMDSVVYRMYSKGIVA
jgi:hypothetical protein